MEMNEKLVSLRKQHGLTQLDLAEKLHVSRQAISRWESGAAVPSTDNLKFLTNLYGVSLDYLVHDDRSDRIVMEETAPIKKGFRQVAISLPVLIAAGVLFFAMAATLISCSVKMYLNDPERIVPMEDMATSFGEDYPVEIVSFD